MKKIALILLTGLLLLGNVALADSLARITFLKGNGSFPTELVTVQYVRHCTEAFSGAWMKQSSVNRVGIAVTVRQVSSRCNFHETNWVTESVVLPIDAQTPTTYYRLKSISGAGSFSGVSVDNFN